VRLPGAGGWVLLVVAVMSVSTAAPIIAASAAPPLAIAFWRCALGAAATLPWAVMTGAFAQVRALDRVGRRRLLLAGVLLALHFAAWVPSVRLTSVAAATALVSTLPLWTALLARAAGLRVGRAAWTGIAVSVIGIAALTGIDGAMDPGSLAGDALALLGGALAAAYVTVGERCRQRLSTAAYTVVAYAAAALVLLGLCLGVGVPLLGFAARDWALMVALTVLAQLLGHTLVNAALRTASATVVGLVLLFEVPGSVLLAAVWLGQWPPPQTVPALMLLIAGLALVVRSADSRRSAEGHAAVSGTGGPPPPPPRTAPPG
jgi:drug/metabolite transporter (DMT)-like permease